MRTAFALPRSVLFPTTLLASAGSAQDTVPTLAPATVVSRFIAEDARQGVAVDARFFYPMSNNRIGKYDKRTGKRVAQWEEPRALPAHELVRGRPDRACLRRVQLSRGADVQLS